MLPMLQRIPECVADPRLISGVRFDTVVRSKRKTAVNLPTLCARFGALVVSELSVPVSPRALHGDWFPKPRDF